MLRRINCLALFFGVITAGFARPVAAQSTEAAVAVRESRRFSIGFSPAWPWVADHDVTAPVPALRLGVNLSPRLAVDFTAGMLRYSDYGGWSLLDLGARWFFTDTAVSPYLMGRFGAFFVDGDEGPDETYRYVTLGAGIEYACGCGFTTWAEVGPALLDPGKGVYVSVGIGYRFGAPPRQQ